MWRFFAFQQVTAQLPHIVVTSRATKENWLYKKQSTTNIYAKSSVDKMSRQSVFVAVIQETLLSTAREKMLAEVLTSRDIRGSLIRQRISLTTALSTWSLAPTHSRTPEKISTSGAQKLSREITLFRAACKYKNSLKGQAYTQQHKIAHYTSTKYLNNQVIV